MPQERTDSVAAPAAARPFALRLHGMGPVVGLVLLCIAGALLNADFGIRTGSLEIAASSLSGGNQQKLALAKVLHPGPKVIVLDEPTRGVDVGAKRDIYFLIQRLAGEGCAVIVISSELIELIGICHRIVVMRAGRVQATLSADQLTEEVLIAHATGTH